MHASLGRSLTHGLTLIEACIGMAVVAVLSATAVPSFTDTFKRRNLDGIASELAADLQQVRTEAVSRQEGVRWTLLPVSTGSCAVVHTGSAGACQCSAEGVAQCSGSAELIRSRHYRLTDGVSVSANVSSLRIEPTHGMSTPAGTVLLDQGGGKSLRHVVNIMGRVRTCSPGGAVSGYRAC